MASTSSNAARSQEVHSLDGVRPRMAKADSVSPSSSIAWTDVVRAALIKRFGSLKAAAIEMRIDQSQLTRDLDNGKLNIERLRQCDAQFALILGQLLVEHAQPLATPRARWEDLNQRQRQIDAERNQLFDYVVNP